MTLPGISGVLNHGLYWYESYLIIIIITTTVIIIISIFTDENTMKYCLKKTLFIP